MLAIGNLLISEDIIEKEFVCNLNACLGACCVAGDSGAPIEPDELAILGREFDSFKKYLTPEGVELLNHEGVAVFDEEDQKHKTPLLKSGACAYITFDENKVACCGIEKAYLAKETSFKKPISCHLYPIRITHLKNGTEAVNYERWEICKSACKLGKQLGVPIYKFVKEALIRKYGEEVYEAIDAFAHRKA